MESADWTGAADVFDRAGNDEQLMKCYYLADDIEALERLMMKLPHTSALLPVIGRMFVSIGAVDQAVTAFKSCGDISAAVDACARLNHWKPALELAGKGRSHEIRTRMTRYANELIDNGQTAAAIDFYARAGLGLEAAKLLVREGNELLKAGEDYISAKMCFVFAGLQVEKHRKGAFDGSATAAERLEGLMKDDEATTSGLLGDIWRHAEGVHFYLLSHRQIFARRWMDALLCACRVFDDYAEVVGVDRAAALLAMTSLKTKHFGHCSRAMTTLEHYEEYSPEKRAKFEDMAIDIFMRNAPVNPRLAAGVNCPKCGAVVSMLDSQCKECGNKMKVCVATGRLIEEGAWECTTCKHSVVTDVADSLAVCPMCHHRVPD
jgi:WD repeat-containing protein 35